MMDFINHVLKIINDNIFFSGIVLVIIFILTSIFTPFFEPIGKKLYYMCFKPKILINMSFINLGYSSISPYNKSGGFWGAPTTGYSMRHDYDYYLSLTNISGVDLTDLSLKLEHSILPDYMEDNDFEKEFKIDYLKIGDTREIFKKS